MVLGVRELGVRWVGWGTVMEQMPRRHIDNLRPFGPGSYAAVQILNRWHAEL